MPEVVSPCQLGLVRFTPVQARRLSRVPESAHRSPSFFRSVQETGFPVGSYKSEVFEAVSSAPVAASAVRLVHPLTNVVRNSVDGTVLGGGFPCGGTRGAIDARRPLSTGFAVQGRRVDEDSSVSAAQRGCPLWRVHRPHADAEDRGGPVSAVAAPAALPRPRTFVGGAARRRLRSVPAQAGPVVPLKVGNPLQRTETMHTRLLAAVRALLSDPGPDSPGTGVRRGSVGGRVRFPSAASSLVGGGESR